MHWEYTTIKTEQCIQEGGVEGPYHHDFRVFQTITRQEGGIARSHANTENWLDFAIVIIITSSIILRNFV